MNAIPHAGSLLARWIGIAVRSRAGVTDQARGR